MERTKPAIDWPDLLSKIPENERWHFNEIKESSLQANHISR